MYSILVSVILFVFAFISMEGVAWFAHKYIMHGFLWVLHKDHHHKDSDEFLEHNDSFFIIFATPAIVCILFGTLYHISYVLPIGLGITAYGVCYFIVHDIFIHQRFKWLRNANHIYFKGIRRAHKIHHKHIQKEDGECFGMLWVPMKYFRENLKN